MRNLKNLRVFPTGLHTFNDLKPHLVGLQHPAKNYLHHPLPHRSSWTSKSKGRSNSWQTCKTNLIPSRPTAWKWCFRDHLLAYMGTKILLYLEIFHDKIVFYIIPSTLPMYSFQQCFVTQHKRGCITIEIPQTVAIAMGFKNFQLLSGNILLSYNFIYRYH